MDAGAMQAAAAASAAQYRSFADATRSVLDLLAQHLPDSCVYLAHLDRAQEIHRIVDARNGGEYRLRSNQAIPLQASFCVHMADGLAPRRTGDVPRDPVYGGLEFQRRVAAASFVGVPVELSDGSRVGSIGALSRAPDRFGPDDERLLGMLARVLASELERESTARDLKRMDESLRGQARSLAAIGRAVRALASQEDARPAICEAACEITGAPVAFLLEPSGRDFASTAMTGVDMAPVTIQPRPEAGGGRPFASLESYFVADATDHPALAPPLVRATRARSALFEPIPREGSVAGVLIIIWQETAGELPESISTALRLLAAQAAVAIEQANLRARLDDLALTDALTGLGTRRSFEEELPRELARARRNEMPVCVALIDLDHLAAFNMLRGEREGDRLLKEAAAAWTGGLREVDLIARLEGDEFGVILPGCSLGEAVEVLDRVRNVTPREQTSSAGVSRWNGEEPAEILLLRCADALAAAKAAGRDVTIAGD